MEMNYATADYGREAEDDEQMITLPMATSNDIGGDPSVVIGAPESTAELTSINVYADSINAVSYQITSPVAAFDVVFSVSIVDPEDGTARTYKVVKRIGVDRMKMARDAESSVPVSVVEAQQPAAPVIAEAHLVSRERALAIAGIKVRT
jgi:hypothetical protein